MEVLPAGGINSGNVAELVRQTACDQVHGSLRGLARDFSAPSRPNLTFSGPPPPADGYELTDPVHVHSLRKVLDAIAQG